MSVVAQIQEEIGLVNRLLSLLDDEQRMLRAGQTDELAELTQQKNALAERIDAAEAARQQMLSVQYPGLAPAAAIQQWLRAPEGILAQAPWNELLNLARQVQRAMGINAQLIALHLRHTGDALALLHTAAARGDSLYGSNGLANQLSGRRVIDSA